MPPRTRLPHLTVLTVALGACTTACELAVQIDPGLVDAGAEDGPCPICSPPADDAGDAADDAQAADSGVDSPPTDASRDTIADAALHAGGG